MRKSKWNIENIQEFLDSTGSGCTLVTKEIKFLKDDMEFQCRCGNPFHRKFHNILHQKSYYCEDCSKEMFSESKTLSHEDYLRKLVENNITNIIPLEKYVAAKTKIQHRCKTCGYEWGITPNNVLTGFGCPFCAGQVVWTGKNDIWTTHPEVAKLLANPDDGYKYSIYTNKRLDFICPDCGKLVKGKSTYNVLHYGLSCSNCNDGLSIPNKFVSNVFTMLNMDFDVEKVFDWSDNRRYDFYFIHNNQSYIVEVNGLQHYSDGGFEYCGGRNLEEEMENDKYKERLARENGIKNYIILDCRKSELDYMKNSVQSSILSTLFDLSIVDYNKCYEKCLKSKVIECINMWNNGIKTINICKALKISNTTACEYLRRGNKLGLCKYEGFNERLKPVRCITTNKVFESIKSATIYYDIKGQGHIRDCCNGKRNYCGQDEYGNKLKWEFISKSDYEKLVA